MSRWAGRLLLAAAGAAVLVAGLFGTGWATTPPAGDLQARVAAFAAAHGALPLRSTEIPPVLAAAVVATEDERFYSHHGLDSIGIARAVLIDLSRGCLCEGGSTLTQQLAKLVYLGGSDAGFNKIQGMALATKIEVQTGKAQILADYLSIAPTGPTLYGMGGAACAYFGRPLGQLGLPQLALLAGLPQAPSYYDPLRHPERAGARRAQVLAAMRDNGDITAAQAAAAAAAPYRPPAAPGC